MTSTALSSNSRGHVLALAIAIAVLVAGPERLHTRHAPLLGEHTAELLGDIGLRASEIEAVEDLRGVQSAIGALLDMKGGRAVKIPFGSGAPPSGGRTARPSTTSCAGRGVAHSSLARPQRRG